MIIYASIDPVPDVYFTLPFDKMQQNRMGLALFFLRFKSVKSTKKGDILSPFNHTICFEYLFILFKFFRPFGAFIVYITHSLNNPFRSPSVTIGVDGIAHGFISFFISQ